jgi:hypothetical protein
VQFIPSIISIIVFYFTTAPIMKVVTGLDPMSPEQLAERRAAVVDFVCTALFVQHHQERAPVTGAGRSRKRGRK